MKEDIFLNIYSHPFYRIFVSRSLIKDRVISDSIVEIIREWGFETVTVGIEIRVPDNHVAIAMRKEIE